MQYRPYSLAPRTYAQWLFGLLGVIVAILLVVFLLARVVVTANSINDKAADIRSLGGTINESTAAVLQLTKTNQVASTILGDVHPLSGQLNTTLGTASGISRLATSINNTAGSIDTVAGQIKGSADLILKDTNSIVASAASIDKGVTDIDAKLSSVLGAVQAIKGDSGNIRGTAVSIQSNAKAIDCKLPPALLNPGNTVNNCGEG
jgi:methyl-accepting chemotaxis protein